MHTQCFGAQYKLVQSSRDVLLNYCETVTAEHFVEENSGFGRGGSMRNLLVHCVNTYQFWVGEIGLNLKMEYTTYDSVHSVEEVRLLYKEIDLLIERLIATNQENLTRRIDYAIKQTNNITSPFEIFLHVITHEFHHKGQVLSISRHLGYIPVDTDIIRSL